MPLTYRPQRCILRLAAQPSEVADFAGDVLDEFVKAAIGVAHYPLARSPANAHLEHIVGVSIYHRSFRLSSN
jgi:hypothetical protein